MAHNSTAGLVFGICIRNPASGEDDYPEWFMNSMDSHDPDQLHSHNLEEYFNKNISVAKDTEFSVLQQGAYGEGYESVYFGIRLKESDLYIDTRVMVDLQKITKKIAVLRPKLNKLLGEMNAPKDLNIGLFLTVKSD